MVKRIYSFNLEEKIVEQIPIDNRSEFVTFALCQAMIKVMDWQDKKRGRR